MVDNSCIVEQIREKVGQEFVSYGYQYVTQWLRRECSCLIDDKKVYRLMKEARLLYPYAIRTHGKRTFVRFRKIDANHPFQYLSMDIKYIWLPSERRHCFLLTVLDIASRSIVAWCLKYSMTKWEVIGLFRQIAPNLPKGIKVTVRNDNGSQFLAHDVRAYMNHLSIDQEFCHIATPQENGHIESFHNILERDLLWRNQYTTFEDLKEAMSRYAMYYNEVRMHRSLGYLTPKQWLEKYQDKVGKVQNHYTFFDEAEVVGNPRPKEMV